MPERFPVQMGHHDWVLSMPPDASVLSLVSSESSSCQAIRIGDSAIYATQFHPELAPNELGERLRIYDANYTETDDDVEAIIAKFRPTPDCLTLLPRFVSLFQDARR
jgi:GMP synthase (glutamine-hydrolysing)